MALITRLKNIKNIFLSMSSLDLPDFSELVIPAYNQHSKKYCNMDLSSMFNKYEPFKYLFSSDDVKVSYAFSRGYDPFFSSSNMLFSNLEYFNNNSASVNAKYSSLITRSTVSYPYAEIYLSDSNKTYSDFSVFSSLSTPQQYTSLFSTGVPFCHIAYKKEINCLVCSVIDYSFGPEVEIPTFSKSSNVNAQNIRLWANMIEMAELYYEQVLNI